MGYCSRLGIITVLAWEKSWLVAFSSLEEKFAPSSRNRLIAHRSCLSPLAVNIERHSFGHCSLHFFLAKIWQGLLYYAPHIFSRNVAHWSDSLYAKALNFTQIVCTCYIVTLSITHLKAICVPFIAYSVPFIFQYSTSQKKFLRTGHSLCSAKITQFTAIEIFAKHNGRPNKPKPGACDRPRD